QLEPGLYKEQVVVPDGVDLVARLPGKSILERQDDVTGPWNPVIAAGRNGGRVYGLRIPSAPEAPITVGIHASGQGHRIELVDVDGPMRVAIELSDATAITIQGCTLHISGGAAFSLDERSEASVLNNIVIRGSGTAVPAMLL